MDPRAPSGHINNIGIIAHWPGELKIRRVGSPQPKSAVKRLRSRAVICNTDPPCFPFLSNVDRQGTVTATSFEGLLST